VLGHEVGSRRAGLTGWEPARRGLRLGRAAYPNGRCSAARGPCGRPLTTGARLV